MIVLALGPPVLAAIWLDISKSQAPPSVNALLVGLILVAFAAVIVLDAAYNPRSH